MTPARYHPALATLHWLLAAMIVGALAAGTFLLAPVANADPAKMFSFRAHMSLGVAILALTLVRLALRLATRKPAPATTGTPALDRLAGLTHWAFYALVIAMCASGIALALAAGLPQIVFFGTGDPLPINFNTYTAWDVHGALANGLMALIALHVAAALWHHFIRKDGLLRRMNPRGRDQG